MDQNGFSISALTSSKDCSLARVVPVQEDADSEPSVNQGAESQLSEPDASIVSSVSENAGEAGLETHAGEVAVMHPAVADAVEGCGNHDPEAGWKMVNTSDAE